MNATYTQTRLSSVTAKSQTLPPCAMPAVGAGRATSTARNGSKDAIRVLVVDDHPVVRQGLSSCLANRKNVLIVGQAADGRQALRLVKELSPDIVLMDLDMPQMSGLTATDLLRKENPGVKILILSMHTHSEYVLRMLQCGARGYVLKDVSTDEMLRAIETVHSGGTYFSADIARLALNQFVRGAANGDTASPISNREREVLVAIAEGLSNKEIACRLSVGVRTIETHRERIMRKLNIHSVAGLTKFAIQKGLIPMPKEPEAGFCQ